MCLFCKIANDEITSNKVHENGDFMAFHDINPKAPVHILAIPKKHVDSFNEVTPEMMAGMTAFIQEVVEKVDIKESGYRIISNVGENGGQEVKHRRRPPEMGPLRRRRPERLPLIFNAKGAKAPLATLIPHGDFFTPFRTHSSRASFQIYHQ